MWWQPRTDDERAVRDTVFRLNDYFLTPSSRIPDVYGVGSTIDEGGRRVPLLVLDRSLAPKRRVGVLDTLLNVGRAGLDLFFQLSRVLLPFNVLIQLGRPLSRLARTLTLLQRGRLFVPLLDAGPRAGELLSSWRLPEATRLLFSQPPLPLGRGPGTRIWAGEEDGTLGFRLRIGDRTVFSTAGHVVSSVPSPISIRSEGFLRGNRIEEIGTVAFANDPKRWPGVDVAIVEPSYGYPAASNSPAMLADAPSVPNRASAMLLGGRSHIQWGWVSGALQSTMSEDGRIWKNCWIVMETLGGFARRGDSGGPVVLDATSEVLGHLVAVQGTIRTTGRSQSAIVQDIRTSVEYLEGEYGTPVIVLDEGLPRPAQ